MMDTMTNRQAMKRIFNIFVFLFLSMLSYAQELSVSSFELEKTDITANTAGTTVQDQNGEKCALIKVQTTQTGFNFDVGSLGVQKTIQKVGEIWVYVPAGVKKMSIRHPKLGSNDYEFGIPIERAKTYKMVLNSGKVFINNYDDSRKQYIDISVSPKDATFTLNGMDVELDNQGKAAKYLSFGTYTYRVEAFGFYPKEGQIEIDSENTRHSLIVNDLKPIMGKLSVYINVRYSELYIDNKLVAQTSSSAPYELQIGKHTVEVRANGYKTETQTAVIEEGKTTPCKFNLQQTAWYQITSEPSGALVSINGERLGSTPCRKEMTTGNYNIVATLPGYKDFKKTLALSSSSPKIHINLAKIYNYKNEFYVEADVKAGTYMAAGVSFGGYINNINIEAAGFYGFEKSETIYWGGNGSEPVSGTYSPQLTVSGKVGYGIPLGTRCRITPQAGIVFLKTKETMDKNAGITPVDGAYTVGGSLSLRFSVALIDNLALSLCPEYSLAIMKSKGYEKLSEISPKIKKWSEGVNIKFGITAFF